VVEVEALLNGRQTFAGLRDSNPLRIFGMEGENPLEVVADIPGIIEGAHEGKGLGLQFLRHIERTRMLAFMIPIDSMDWQAEYDQLRAEIAAHSGELARKPHCVVFSKMDLLGEDEAPPIEAPDAFGLFTVSAAARRGLEDLLAAWWSQLLGMKKADERAAAASRVELP
jgi:GTP-binding protein